MADPAYYYHWLNNPDFKEPVMLCPSCHGFTEPHKGKNLCSNMDCDQFGCDVTNGPVPIKDQLKVPPPSESPVMETPEVVAKPGKPPSKEWLQNMAELEGGKCTSVGGLAVELGLYKKPDTSETKQESDPILECTCPCHEGKARHFAPCCTTCRVCNKRIKIGYEEEHRASHQAHHKKPSNIQKLQEQAKQRFEEMAETISKLPSESPLQMKAIKVVELAIKHDEIIKSDDGYFVWWPEKSNGYLESSDLRAIADHLDERNKEWDAKCKSDPAINPPAQSCADAVQADETEGPTDAEVVEDVQRTIDLLKEAYKELPAKNQYLAASSHPSIVLLEKALSGDRGDQQHLIAQIGLDWLALILRKNHDYGGTVFESPILDPTLPAVSAIDVRMSDKIGRIKTLATKGSEVAESLDETYDDLGAYCLLRRVAIVLGKVLPKK